MFPPCDRPDRGPGAHHGLGDLPGHRTSGHRAGQVQPARQGAGPAGPGTPGRAQGAGRGLRRPRRGRSGAGSPPTCPSATPRPGWSSRSAPPSTGSRVGQLVATGGAGKANHAEFQAVPGLLCAVVPEGVPPQDAAFATLASIPLHALRLSGVGPGCQGRGARPRAGRPARGAAGDGLGLRRGRDRPQRVRQEDRGAGRRAGPGRVRRRHHEPDPAAGPGAGARTPCWSAPPASRLSRCRRAPALCRDRATVVMVGDVGMPPRRTPYYEREISLLFARSYGPGRYEPSYEAWGVDYPAGQVRWTEGRNQEAVLDLLAAGRLGGVRPRYPLVRYWTARTRLTGCWRSGPSLYPRYPAWLSGGGRPATSRCASGPPGEVPARPPRPARGRLDRGGRVFHRDAAARLPATPASSVSWPWPRPAVSPRGGPPNGTGSRRRSPAPTPSSTTLMSAWS